MSNVVYTASFSDLVKTPFWSLLTTTVKYEPVTVITQSKQHHHYIQSLLYTASISLPRVQLMTIDDYMLFHSGYDHHDVPGLLEVVTHQVLRSWDLAAHSDRTITHTQGFIKEIITLIYHFRDYPVDLATIKTALGPHFSELSDIIIPTIKDVRTLLKQLCPSHSLFKPDIPKYTATPLFIIDFLNCTSRHRHLLHHLINHTDTLSWFLPDDLTLHDAVHQTIKWATTLSNPLSHIPYQSEKRGSPTLYIADSPFHAYDWVMRHISDRCKDSDTTPNQFAVVLPNNRTNDHTLQRLSKHYRLPLKYPLQRLLSDTPLFQSMDSVIKMVTKGIHFSSILNVFMAPLIDYIRINVKEASPVMSPVMLPILNWIDSEIDSHLSAPQWIKQVKQLQSDSNQSRSQRLDQFLDQFMTLTTVVEASKTVQCADTVISFFKTIEHSFYLCPKPCTKRGDSQNTLQLRHYHAFWDALHVYTTYHYPIASSWTLPLFWQKFSQFASHRWGTDEEAPLNGISVYRIGDWVPSHYNNVYVLGTAASHWAGKRTISRIVPHHAQPPLKLTHHATFSESQATISFSQIKALSYCMFIHSTTDDKRPQLPSPLVLSWPQEPIPLLSTTTMTLPSSKHPPLDIPLTDTPLDTILHSSEIVSHFREKISQFKFSATSLQSYQDCPHQFFLKRVLGLPSYKQQDETVKATIWGKLIHHFLQQFFSSVSKRTHLNTKSHFIATAHTIFNQYYQPSFFWSLKKILLFGNESRPGLVTALWQHLHANPLPQTPHDFESTFLLSLSNNDTSLTIKGAIDLLLCDADHSWMTVVDYKTGKTLPSPKDIEQLRSIQLPIYLLAAKKNYPNSHISGGMVFQIRDESTIGHHVLCSDPIAKKEVFDLGRKRPYTWDDFFFTTIEAYLLQIKSHIDQAKFSYTFYPNPDITAHKRQQSTCRYCDYHLVCRDSKRFH
jgi:hypothetical protein